MIGFLPGEGFSQCAVQPEFWQAEPVLRRVLGHLGARSRLISDLVRCFFGERAAKASAEEFSPYGHVSAFLEIMRVLGVERAQVLPLGSPQDCARRLHAMRLGHGLTLRVL
jgi:hypothetical protein